MPFFEEVFWCCLRAAIFLFLRSHFSTSEPKLATEPIAKESYGPKRRCKVCTKYHPGWRFPSSRITSACEDNTNVCWACLREWLRNCIEIQGRAVVVCPTCAEILSYEEVSKWSTKGIFEKYDELLFRGYLNEEKEFHWCINPSCSRRNNGQIHIGGDPKMICIECGFEMCINKLHGRVIPWHKNLTCKECYSKHVRQGKDTAKSLWLIERTTKACPKCKVLIEKIEHCDHFTCTPPVGCGTQFCWECLALWSDVLDRGWKAHANGCRYHDPTHGKFAPMNDYQ
ncbi:hypothetical protein N431DRAFT_323331 [Stipitochalara longipes BDJ]|nr:hypothetical protein N431DRAFT_323331 [Stipitochalara longipes BDJ]